MNTRMNNGRTADVKTRLKNHIKTLAATAILVCVSTSALAFSSVPVQKIGLRNLLAVPIAFCTDFDDSRYGLFDHYERKLPGKHSITDQLEFIMSKADCEADKGTYHTIRPAQYVEIERPRKNLGIALVVSAGGKWAYHQWSHLGLCPQGDSYTCILRTKEENARLRGKFPNLATNRFQDINDLRYQRYTFYGFPFLLLPVLYVHVSLGGDGYFDQADLTAHDQRQTALIMRKKQAYTNYLMSNPELRKNVKITALHSTGVCLDVVGVQSRRNGANIATWQCDQVNEHWNFTDDGKIQAAWDPSMCLDVAGTNASHNGANIGLWRCDQVTEKWNVLPNGQLQARWNTNKCVDVAGVDSMINGTNIQLWDCNYAGESDGVTETWLNRMM